MNTIRNEKLIGALLGVGLALLGSTFTAVPAWAGHHAEQRMAASNTIVETAAEAGQFETLLAAAKAAGLVDALTGKGPLTVFAPTDEAFGALARGTVETLLKPDNRDQLARILKYHVVAGAVGSDALADGVRLETLAGATARIAATEGGFAIENARIVATDIEASNGLVHVIDRVILPPERMSRADAARSIRGAINRGAPMFNHGDRAGTHALYADTAMRLLREAELDTGDANRLRRGLAAAQAADSSADAAWQLRYAMDDVLESLEQDTRMARVN
jgi:uncharacterized surface protein with fasciclin (FAS1) repeats